MPIPIQQALTPDQDLLYQRMRSAYEGDSPTWQAVTASLRDAMLDHAVRSTPYWRDVVPSGAAFEDVPLLTKEVIRTRLEDLLAEGLPAERRLRWQTSGSTGEPMTFYADSVGQLPITASSDRFFRWLHGVPFEAPIVAVTGVGSERYSWSRHWARAVRARLPGAAPPPPWVYPLFLAEKGPRDLDREIVRWGRLGRYFVVGQASLLDWIADHVERRGTALRGEPVAVCTTADLLTEHARRRIERVFGAPLHSRYGSIESRWVAASIPGDLQRYVFNPLRAYVELLDDEGRGVGPGQLGRIVITDLNNHVMPLIRYDTGDLAMASAEGFVGGFPLVDGIIGRSSDVLRFPSGKVLSAGSVGALLFFGRDHLQAAVRFFQCAQTAPNELELRIVWRDGSTPELERELAEALGPGLDPGTVVRVRAVEALERLPSGKSWIVRREFQQPRNLSRR